MTKNASRLLAKTTWLHSGCCRFRSGCCPVSFRESSGLRSFFYCWSKHEGAALFFDPEMSFSRPRDWSILFSAAVCLFFDLQLFFSPAMRPRKRAQSFFQPLCIILSSLFLGPEKHLVANPGSFFEPRDIFFWTSGAFFCGRDAHTRRDEKQIANQELGKLGNKSQERKNKGTELHATDNKNQKLSSHTTRRKPHKKRFRGLKAMKKN